MSSAKKKSPKKPSAAKKPAKKAAAKPKKSAKKVAASRVEAQPSSAALLFHAMYLMAIIDGEVEQAELQVVEGLLTGLPEFASTTVERLVADSTELVVRHGGAIESLIALTGLTKKAERTKCYLLAAEVAYASGGVGKAEAALLHTMRKVLGLDASTTKSIMSVLAMKYV